MGFMFVASSPALLGYVVVVDVLKQWSRVH
jgi:hypothetical protein